MSFLELDYKAGLLYKLHEVRGDGMGMLRGWRSWEITSRSTITTTPQMACRPRRVIIPASIAADWVIFDLRVNSKDGSSKTHISSGQGIPGSFFFPTESENIDVGPVAAMVEIAMTVEYIGENPMGEVFTAVLLCEVIDGKGHQALPINSGQNRIMSAARVGELGSGRRIGIQIDDRAWVFRQDRTKLPFEIVIGESDLRIEEPSMDELLYLDTDDGKGSVMRSGEPRPIPGGRIARVNVPFLPHQQPESKHAEVPDLFQVRPRVLSLHVLEAPLPVLFGLDETSNQVVFEIAAEPGYLVGRFDKFGYTPTWWDSAAPWQAPAGLADPAI